MNKNKKWILILVVIIALVIAGTIWGIWKCGQGEQTIQTPDAEDWYFDYMLTSYSNMGCLHVDGGYLYFLDAKTGEDLLLCDDPTCSHDKSTCSAYFEALILFGIVEDDKLLLVTDYGADKFGELYLYETALDGGERKQIAKISDNMQCIMGAEFTDDYIILSYYNQYDENMELLDAQTAGIYVYDRVKESGETVAQTTMWNALTYYPMVIGSQIYYEFLGYDMSKEDAILHADDLDYYQEHLVCGLCTCDLEKEDVEGTFIADVDDFTPIVVYNDSLLYRADGQLYAYHIEDGEKELIGTAMTVIPGDCTEGIYLSQYDAIDSSYDLYLYDGTLNRVGGYKNEWMLNAVYGDVVYALRVDPATYIGELKVSTLSEVLK